MPVAISSAILSILYRGEPDVQSIADVNFNPTLLALRPNPPRGSLKRLNGALAKNCGDQVRLNILSSGVGRPRGYGEIGIAGQPSAPVGAAQYRLRRVSWSSVAPSAFGSAAFDINGAALIRAVDQCQPRQTRTILRWRWVPYSLQASNASGDGHRRVAHGQWCAGRMAASSPHRGDHNAPSAGRFDGG